MEKYPKKILDNLRDGEVIIYKAEKGPYNHFCDFLVLPIIFLTSVILIISPFVFKLSPLLLLFETPLIIFLFWGYITQFQSSVYLTNQRIIIYYNFSDKKISYELEKLTLFQQCCVSNVASINIGDESSKTIICNIKVEKFEEEFRKLMPNFVSQKTKRKMSKQEIIGTIVCVLAIPPLYIGNKTIENRDYQEYLAYQNCIEDKNFSEYHKDLFTQIAQNTEIIDVPQGEKVIVEFKLNEDGTIQNELIVIPSYNDELNDSVFSAISESAPFPELPEKAKAIAPLKIRYNLIAINKDESKVWLEIMKDGNAVTSQSGMLINK